MGRWPLSGLISTGRDRSTHGDPGGAFARPLMGMVALLDDIGARRSKFLVRKEKFRVVHLSASLRGCTRIRAKDTIGPKIMETEG